MRFLQNIISKSHDTHASAPLRRGQVDRVEEHDEDDARPSPSSISPRFSRNTKRIVREVRTPVARDASLHEILDQWKQDTTQDKAPAEEVEDAPVAPKPVVSETKQTKAKRVKTRLLGFDDVTAPDLFDKTKPATRETDTRYPVGWLVITDGPGRGESFTLLTGMSQIGRGEDQAVQLDFGDETISRSNHAAIVYDVETHSFLMGHGGKTNVVRLNGKPLISTETLKSGDQVRIGETCLQLVVFSTPKFNWAGMPVLEAEHDVAAS